MKIGAKLLTAKWQTVAVVTTTQPWLHSTGWSYAKRKEDVVDWCGHVRGYCRGY